MSAPATEPRPSGGRPPRAAGRVTAYLVCIILAVFAFGPLVTVFFNSLKSDSEVAENPLGPPSDPLLSNFGDAWDQGALAQALTNSALITLGTVIGVGIVAGLGAYALARLEVRGATLITVYFLAITVVPAQLFIVPLFALWTQVGLSDTRLGLIIIYTALFSPFITLLLRSFLITIPREFENAARIDGAGEISVLFRVIMPLAWPGLLTAALVTGLSAWNEFFFAITFLASEETLPVTASFAQFQQGYAQQWGLINAAAIIIVVPVVLLFLSMQRRFVAGLTASGVKG